MKLAIQHETIYRYDARVHHSIQYLRLTPRADSSQSVIAWTVTTPGKLKRWIDGFGNVAHVSVQNGVHDELPVTVRGEVETIDTCGMLPADDGLGRVFPAGVVGRIAVVGRAVAGEAGFLAGGEVTQPQVPVADESLALAVRGQRARLVA